jgi:Flp pilus assembly pilin Flp
MFSRTHIFRALSREHGQTMSEYALTLAVVTLAVIAAISQLSSAIEGRIGDVATRIAGLVP